MARSLLAPVWFLLSLTPLATGDRQSIDDLPTDQARFLRAAIVESLYCVRTATEGVFVATNPGQEMRSTFDACGIEVSGPRWSLRLALQAWGRKGALLPVEDPVIHAEGRRVEYHRGALTEWYVNEARGLEQGFSIEAAPAGEGALALVLSVESDDELSVDVLSGGRDACFSFGGTDAMLHYAGLRAFDATGRELVASMSADGRRLSIEVEDEGAVYPLVVDPWVATELAKLTAGDGAANDSFGGHVAVFGDIAVVGATGDDHAGGTDAGSAYVFERDQGGPGAWGEIAKLTSSDAAAFDQFGKSIADSGDMIVVGAEEDDHAGGSNAGSAYVYGISFASEVYCTAGTSASGCQAGISAAGTAIATASSGFALMAGSVEGAKDGLFFFASNGKQANPWGNGTSYQCVVPPVRRAGLLTSVGTVGACDGSFSLDLNAHWCPTCPKPNHNPGAGTFIQAQLWYRDPQSTSNQTTSLSDAIESLVGP